jgi:hypothetical protein
MMTRFLRYMDGVRMEVKTVDGPAGSELTYSSL